MEDGIMSQDKQLKGRWESALPKQVNVIWAPGLNYICAYPSGSQSLLQMVPAYWYRLGIITCYFPETSTGTGSCCWRRYVSAHADRFIVQRACPGPRPGLTYLLVITLSCLNTPFLRGNSLRGFVICLSVESVLALFPVIRSSLLGIEPVF